MKTLEKLLNAYLSLDPNTKPLFDKLNGKTFAIEMPVIFNFVIQLYFVSGAIQLSRCVSVNEVDTILRASPLTLLRLLANKQNRNTFFADQSVVLEGNIDIAQTVMQLFDELDIDWEELLSHYVGDTTAYYSGRMVKKIKQVGKQYHRSLLENITEYIHEEGEWIPPKEAIHDFNQAVDELRMDVDRLMARVERVIP